MLDIKNIPIFFLTDKSKKYLQKKYKDKNTNKT
jgi:hypothetical protein